MKNDTNTAGRVTFTCKRDARFVSATTGKASRDWHGSNGTVVFIDWRGVWTIALPDGREAKRTKAAAAFRFAATLDPAMAPDEVHVCNGSLEFRW